MSSFTSAEYFSMRVLLEAGYRLPSNMLRNTADVDESLSLIHQGYNIRGRDLKTMGIVPAPFDCYQVLRSIKTLELRMKRHMESSLIIARFLENHPKVGKVIHPGLPSHPQHDLFKSQTCGNSGMLSFYLKGDLNESNEFLKALRMFTLGESLGGYESLAELPSIMTHASVPLELRNQLGITNTLIRLSVGLEDVEDLVTDLQQALEKI